MQDGREISPLRVEAESLIEIASTLLQRKSLIGATGSLYNAAYLVGATKTRDFFLLNREMVIIGDFFSRFDVPFGINDDL
jgi:hypothetical protein